MAKVRICRNHEPGATATAHRRRRPRFCFGPSGAQSRCRGFMAGWAAAVDLERPRVLLMITPRSLTPSGPTPAARITAMISPPSGDPVDSEVLCYARNAKVDVVAGERRRPARSNSGDSITSSFGRWLTRPSSTAPAGQPITGRGASRPQSNPRRDRLVRRAIRSSRKQAPVSTALKRESDRWLLAREGSCRMQRGSAALGERRCGRADAVHPWEVLASAVRE